MRIQNDGTILDETEAVLFVLAVLKRLGIDKSLVREICAQDTPLPMHAVELQTAENVVRRFATEPVTYRPQVNGHVNSAVDEFLARGGKITKLRPGHAAQLKRQQRLKELGIDLDFVKLFMEESER